MVAPYSPTEEDFERLYSELPPFNINCERLKRTFNCLLEVSSIFFIFYYIAKISSTRTNAFNCTDI